MFHRNFVKAFVTAQCVWRTQVKKKLAREIEKAGVGDLVKDQISAPGVKAGTPQAAVAKKVVSKAAQAQGATA